MGKIIVLIKKDDVSQENSDYVIIGANPDQDVRNNDFQNNLPQPLIDRFPIEKRIDEICWADRSSGIEDGTYYYVSWDKEKQEIDFSIPFEKMSAHDVVQGKHDSLLNTDRDNLNTLSRMMSTLQNQLTAGREDTFVYELLQNANDYPVLGKSVDVKFIVLPNALLFLHTGRKFNDNNVLAICDVNYGDKDKAKGAIGYKGIGFKTVFQDCEYVYIKTGDYTFRLDKQAAKKENKSMPWQVFPIWTEANELDPDVRDIISAMGSEYRVGMVLKPRDPQRLKEYVKLFHEVFDDERVILFVPNVDQVKISLQWLDPHPIVCRKDNEHWIVSHFEAKVDSAVTQKINEELEYSEERRIPSKIPGKFKDFTKTLVSFACKRDGDKLIMEEESKLYCYLPTQVSWGFNFLMNTDMIPNGSRDEIQKDFNGSKLNVNKEIAEIAGENFFDWIIELLKSDNYHFSYSSIFSLIPNFEKCADSHADYADFIHCFQKGFEKRVQKEAFIPDNEGNLWRLDQIVLDKTGLTANHIFTDDEFCKFAGYEKVNMHAVSLRKDKHFVSCLDYWLRAANRSNSIWDKKNLLNATSSSVKLFHWLSNQDNNNTFIQFLIDKDWLRDFRKKMIFIDGMNNRLRSVNGLYYGSDSAFENLKAFKDFLHILSVQTRDHFKGNKKWMEFTREFEHFDANDFINSKLFQPTYLEDVRKILYDKTASIGFYRFIAQNETTIKIDEKLKGLPYFDNKSVPIEKFDADFIFLPSSTGKDVLNESWLINAVNIKFLSPEYDKQTQDLFTKHFGVKKFDHKVIVEDIIQNGNYVKRINKAINEDEEKSKQFVDYCYAHRFLFKDQAKGYSLKSVSNSGDDSWVAVSEDPVYFNTPYYRSVCQYGWLPEDCMYELGTMYAKDSEHEKFMKEIFNVEYLDPKECYNRVVKKNLTPIFDLVNPDTDEAKNLNYSFIKYLDENSVYIFKENHDEKKFTTLHFITTGDLSESMESQSNIYLYDSDAYDIRQRTWMPEGAFAVCSKEYGKSTALKAIGVKTYSFAEFFNNVISQNIVSINEQIDDKTSNVDFQQLVFDHCKEISDEKNAVIKKTHIFLAGKKEVVENAEGHFLPSDSVQQLIKLGYIDVVTMNLLAPEYIQDQDAKDYWTKRIGNKIFGISQFADWLVLEDYAQKLSQHLREKKSNLEFWNWAKTNVQDKILLQKFSVLPIMLQGEDAFSKAGDVVYLSDCYLETGRIENLVKKYAGEKATVLSSQYLDKNATKEVKKEWCDFWVKVGLKKNVLDILTETVMKDLSNFKIADLPLTLANYRSELEEHYGDPLQNHLQGLQLLCVDRQSYCDISYVVMMECDGEEPFSYIILPNEVRINDAGARKLVKQTLPQENVVKEYFQWVKLKVKRYVEIQNSKLEDENFMALHYRFINDMAKMAKDHDNYFRDMKLSDVVLLYDRNNKLTAPTSLTLGSIYKPSFNFESCGINLHYINDKYKECCGIEIRNFLGSKLGVHYKLGEEDIPYLSSFECSKYFWGTYISTWKKRNLPFYNSIKGLVLSKFNDMCCIPTMSHNVVKPAEAYSPELHKYVQHTPNYKDNMPMLFSYDKEDSACHELYNCLNFKTSLNFDDALSALDFFNGQNKMFEREQLVSWIVEAYDDTMKPKIDEYRNKDNSKWYNVRKELSPISTLYALDSGDTSLANYFGSNERIIDTRYLNRADYSYACEVLQIKIIKKEDIDVVPVDKKQYFKKNQDLKIFALTFAGTQDIDNWNNYYSRYLEALNKLRLYLCTSISTNYKYDKSIKKDMLMFYRNENEFYFVKDLDNKRVFSSFVKGFTDYLGIEVDKEVAEEIMDSRESAENYIKENFEDRADNSFKERMHSLDKSVTLKEDMSIEPEDEEALSAPYNYQHDEDEPHVDDDSMYNEDDLSKTDNIREIVVPPEPDKPTEAQEEPQPTEPETDDSQSQTGYTEKTKEDVAEDMERWKNVKTNTPTTVRIGGMQDNLEPQGTPENINGNQERNKSKDNSPAFKHRRNDSLKIQRLSDNSTLMNRAGRQAASSKDRMLSASEADDTLLKTMELLNETPKYTYRWFLNLLYLEEKDKGLSDKLNGNSIKVSFFDVTFDDGYIILSQATPYIPASIADSPIIPMTFVLKNGTRKVLNAQVLSLTNKEIVLDLSQDIFTTEEWEKFAQCNMNVEIGNSNLSALSQGFAQLKLSDEVKAIRDEFKMDEHLPINMDFIYGPPGTGKTKKLVELIHDTVKEQNADSKNILVLTPTNKAADVIVKRLMVLEDVRPYVKRFGTTIDEDLTMELDILANRATLDLCDSNVNVVVTNTTRYVYDSLLQSNEQKLIRDVKWDYVFIDEASMINIIDITYVLYKAKDAKFTICGDPFQIQPVCHPYYQNENIYSMVGLRSFSEVVEGPDSRYKVIPLTTQYRSIPSIGKLVSEYTYDGKVQANRTEESRKPLALDGIDVKSLNIVSFKVGDFDFLYEINSINNSPLQIYSIIFTCRFANYICKQVKEKYPGEEYSIGIISPYKTEADSISNLLESIPMINENCKITCGTVHSFQGDECDIILFVMNPPSMHAGANAHINNHNILNVAMSRASDYLFILSPQLLEYGLNERDAICTLATQEDCLEISASKIESAMSNGNPNFIDENTSICGHNPINVYNEERNQERSLYEVRISDTAIDIKINSTSSN